MTNTPSSPAGHTNLLRVPDWYWWQLECHTVPTPIHFEIADGVCETLMLVDDKPSWHTERLV